jgi:hypothetical protein
MLSQLRQKAQKLRLHIKNANVDDLLFKLYGEFIEYIDGYTDLLSTLDGIDHDANTKTQSGLLDSGVAAFSAGSAVSDIARNQGYQDGDAARMGIAVGMIKGLIDACQKNQEINETRRLAMDRALRLFQDKWDSLDACTDFVTHELARKYGWSESETRSRWTKDEWSQLEAALPQMKKPGVVFDAWERAVKQHPRDPFLWVEFYKTFASVAVLNRWPHYGDFCQANALLITFKTELIPADSAYDTYREWILHSAGDALDKAFNAELLAKNRFGGSENFTAACAVKVWNDCLKYTDDPSGEVREKRAWALGASGKLPEAMAQAEKITALRRDSAQFAYNYACLECRLSHSRSAAEWFKHAVEDLGYNSISTAKADPDLELMRNEQGSEFTRLTSVKADWDVKFGVFNDDIILTNRSCFPISNVVLDIKLSQDSSSWTPQLKADVIGPGKTYTWENIVRIPSGRLTTKSATLKCDQNK